MKFLFRHGPALVFLASHSLAFGQVAAPVFAPGAANNPVAFSVTVNCATSGATIRYTTNGSDPTPADPQVPAGNLVVIPVSVTLKAKAWSGPSSSTVTSADYKIVGQISAGGFHTLAVKSNRAAYW